MKNYNWGNLYTPNMYGEIIVKIASQKKKLSINPQGNYDEIVHDIANWIENLLGMYMPRLSDLTEMIADAFLLVIKSKRKSPDLKNFESFLDHLRADVYRELFKGVMDKDLGIKTKYELKH
jgi:hypothetical protein